MSIGRLFILIGIVFIGMGLIFVMKGHIPWLGRLPGDIAVKHENFSFYFPLTTCLFVSLILSLVFYLFRR